VKVLHRELSSCASNSEILRMRGYEIDAMVDKGPNGDWIEKWAGKYEWNEKLERDVFQSIGSSPSYLTKSTLKMIEDWKWGRKRGLVANNEEPFVREVTRTSLTTRNERLKLEVLTLLNGVGIRMASTILYFLYPEECTIMDWRAWESLKRFKEIEGEITDTFESWRTYNHACRRIAAQNRVSLRELDKALWQFKGGVP